MGEPAPGGGRHRARRAPVPVPPLRLAFETWVGALAAAPIVLMYPLFLVIFGRSTTTIVMIGFAAGLAPVILKTVEGLAGTRTGADRRRPQLQAHARRSSSGRSCCRRRCPSVFVGLRLGLIFAMINIVGVEFLINFGGLGPAHQRARGALRPARHLRRDPVRDPRERSCSSISRERDRAMAAAGSSDAERARRAARGSGRCGSRSSRSRSSAWEALAASGLLFRDVVPSLAAIATRARRACSGSADFYANLAVTAQEIGVARHHRRRSRASRRASCSAPTASCRRPSKSLLLYLGPTPKIIFFPVMIMWFGVGRARRSRWASCRASFRSRSAPPPGCGRSTRC